MKKLFYLQKYTDKRISYEDITERNTIVFKSNPKLYSGYGYCDTEGNPLPLAYKLDEYGFRNEVTYQNGTYIALGCSDTFGTGNKIEHRWSNLLSKHYNKDIINLGIPGGSIKSCYRVLKTYTEQYTPKKVYILIPSPFRSEYSIYSEDRGLQYVQIGPSFHEALTDEISYLKTFTEELFTRLYTVKANLEIEHFGYLEAIKGLCASKNIELIGMPNLIFNDFKPLNLTSQQKADIAPGYDITHLGPKYHEYIANYMISLTSRDSSKVVNYSENVWDNCL